MSDIVLLRRPDPLRLAIAPALCVALTLAVCAGAFARLDPATSAKTMALPSAATAASPPDATPPWLEIPRPVQIYSLESPELRRAPLVYAARRLAHGEAREDRVAFGKPSDGGPMLRLSILRGGTVSPSTLGASLPLLLAADGVKARLIGTPAPLATRFGVFEVAAAALDGAPGTACDTFRLTIREPALAISGIGCTATTRPWPRTTLACLIDRLDLASAGEDHALATLFAAAELHRDPTCRGMRLAPDGLHAPWLDDKPATPAAKTRRHVRLIRSAQAT